MSGSGAELMMSAAEATWGMLILATIIIIVVCFFCLLPVYKALQARYTHWEDPENDPRWNSDQFQFSPTSPRMGGRETNKYNRLSVCSSHTVSRGSSFRNTCVFPRMDDQVEIKLPPAYTDLFNPGSADVSSLGTPPAYYSRSQSETEEGSDQLTAQPSEAQLTTKPNQTTETTMQAAIEVVNEAPQPAKPRKTYKKMKKPSDNQ